MESNNSAASADMHGVITRMVKNMRFLGVAYIIFGGLYCLTIVGAVIGIPALISGLRLRESADGFDNWLDKEDGALLRAIERQSRFFSIQAILLTIGLIIIVLSVVGSVLASMAILSTL